MASGISGARVETEGGTSLRMEPITEAAESPSNGRRPIAISYNSDSRAQISVRASASRPSTCSGDM